MLAQITIVCNTENFIETAKQLSVTHDLAFANKLPVATELYLDYNSELPRLCDTNTNTCIDINFTAGSLAHRLKFGGGKGQTIAKAIGISSQNKPHILDATAGLGRDALVLASLGCQLTMVEQSPVLYQMLVAAKQQAETDNDFKQATLAGFEIFNDNSKKFIEQGTIAPVDVIYLDPMYPENKKSALVKKDMQLLQKLLGHSSEDQLEELLKVALKFATQRVVVKRPKSAAALKGPPPTLSISSKKTRYDIYVIKAMQTSV